MVAPAVPVSDAAHRPLDIRSVRLVGGRWAQWQERNANATIPHCIEQIERWGVLDNLRRVVGESGADFRGLWFADSDLYKVMEATAWEIARSGTTAFDDWLDESIGLLARVQEPSGYLHSWIQGVHPELKFRQLELTHEMYCAGHLIQAGVALARADGRTDLLDIARAFADLLDRRFGPGREDGIGGHPEIETALVELYRHTGERRYLDLAARFIDLRGRGLLPAGAFGARYFQDHAPVRQARHAVGHAVRQLYLNAGATDVFLETGDPSLLSAMDAQWESAHERKMYITGAFGAHHRDEAFGDDYELPPDRAYAETCASVADLQWTWRMLLAGGATGPARYAESIERELYNAVAAAVDETGTRFFYANPLQLRPDRHAEENAPRDRQSWYYCACCPPNLARLYAQLPAYVASTSGNLLWIHQLADVDIDVPDAIGRGTLRVRTDYPDSGAITFEFDGEPLPGATVALRIPPWVPPGSVRLDDSLADVDPDGYLRVRLGSADAPGRPRVHFPIEPRLTFPHHRIDAVRGCVAIERGPEVFCVEQVDLPDSVAVDDLVVDASSEVLEGESGTVSINAAIRQRDGDLYGTGQTPSAKAHTPVSAVPFARWGNRGADSMRVWLPTVP